MNVTHHVEDCCAPWELVAVEQQGAVTRRRLRCTRCRRRQVVTVTVMADRTTPKDPADVIPLRSIR